MRPSIATFLLSLFLTAPLGAQTVTFRPNIEAVDNGPFGSKDQMVVTWQTDESHPLSSRQRARQVIQSRPAL